MNTQLPQTDAAIKNATGKDWDEWRAILDAWGAADRNHTEIARYVATEHNVPDWWAQGVTVGYERMIGRREAGQRNDGSYSASASKTVNAPIATVHQALVDDVARSTWLGADVLHLRTQTPKSARFDEPASGFIVAFFLTAKGEKTAVQAQADNIPTAEVSAAWKEVWKERLAALAAYMDANCTE